MYVCVLPVSACHTCAGDIWGQKTVDHLELKLQVFLNYLIWVLGTTFGSLARAVQNLNDQAICQDPTFQIFITSLNDSKENKF